jgi:hypothetical protein
MPGEGCVFTVDLPRPTVPLRRAGLDEAFKKTKEPLTVKVVDDRRCPVVLNGNR